MTEAPNDRSVTAYHRAWAATVIGGRDLLRDPLLIGLLILIPIYFIGAWGWIVPDDSVMITVAEGSQDVDVLVTFPELITAVVTPVTVALVVGITSLFLIQRNRRIDRRLRVVGYRTGEIIVARVGALVTVTVVVIVISLGAMLIHLVPSQPGWFVLALVLSAGIYGAIGGIVGGFLGRTAGVYLLLFVPMLDIVVVQNPLADAPAWASYLPGHHPTELAATAAFTNEIAIHHALWGVVYLAIVGILAGATYTVRR